MFLLDGLLSLSDITLRKCYQGRRYAYGVYGRLRVSLLSLPCRIQKWLEGFIDSRCFGRGQTAFASFLQVGDFGNDLEAIVRVRFFIACYAVHISD